MPSEQSAGSAVGAAAAASRARGLAAVGSVCAGCLAPASSETRITVFFRYLRHVRGHSARYQDMPKFYVTMVPLDNGPATQHGVAQANALCALASL